MSGYESLSEKTKEELNKFRKDVTLIIVGLFLALGIQSLIQFVVSLFPHITAYFYLVLGVVSFVLVLVFLDRAAMYSGLVGRIKQELGNSSGKKT
jgi:4-amino-4-deoxy-L-arabinose transferase-like glycosyltransferase